MTTTKLSSTKDDQRKKNELLKQTKGSIGQKQEKPPTVQVCSFEQ